MGLAKLHTLQSDSGRFPDRGGRVAAFYIDADWIKKLSDGADGNSKATLQHGEGVELLETKEEAMFWLQEPKQLQGASAAVNLANPSIAKLEIDLTGQGAAAGARSGVAAAYFNRLATVVDSSGEFFALPAPSANKVVIVQNASLVEATIVTDDDLTLLDGTANGTFALAAESEQVFYCKPTASLGWFTL